MKSMKAGFSLQYFTEDNSYLLNASINDILDITSGRYNNIFNKSMSASAILQALQLHYVDHGVGIGYIIDNNSEDIIGIGGLFYLEDVSLYEIVYIPFPKFEESIAVVSDFLVDHAFSNLAMDKVCVRAIAGSNTAKWLQNSGFVYGGERAFLEDGYEHIWHYYEMENEENLVASASQATSMDSDWDSIF